MRSDQTQIYQDVILRESRNPYHFLTPPNSDAWVKTSGSNPLCGDQIELYIQSTAKKIDSVFFHGHFCAICKASASILCRLFIDMRWEEASLAQKEVQKTLSGHPSSLFPKIANFSCFKDFKTRWQCALLPWQTLAHKATEYC